jgi:DNA topoisomerase-1
MQVKKGCYGPFLACTAYPQCKNIKSLEGAAGGPAPAEPLDEKCPKCGSGLVIKPTRVGGRFISCTGYPNCRYSRGMPVGVPCPQCGGEIVEKTSRGGKFFFGCGNYPKCDFATWDRPLPKPCPECEHPFLVEKTTRRGTTVRCPANGCKYQQQ